MSAKPRRVIAWFRRDLRLDDNRMLAAATHDAERVWPVFVADPALLAEHAKAAGRTAWFGSHLRALDDRLREHGSGLTVLHGEPQAVLAALAGRVEAGTIYAARDEDPVAVARDARVAAALELELVDDQRLLPPGALRTAAGDPFRVYTPFRRALDERLAADPGAITATAVADLGRLAERPRAADGPGVYRMPDAPHPLPPAGERAASGRLRAFVRDRLAGYRDGRDRPDQDGTSRLSMYLRVGALSIRAAWRAALTAEDEARADGDHRARRAARRWRDELAWREFYASVLHAHPRVAAHAFRAGFDDLAWATGRDADEALAAWREGRTGYPLVDAGMRQLVATGWMHNRARLVTASFLVKDLGIDWRRGEAVFMEHLLDGDLAQNNGNWQWVAGVGTDAAPYFRILNPVVQARRFDPAGEYVRRWVPELADLPPEHLHEPWSAPRASRPTGYPAPIVDHQAARRRALERYAAVRSG